MTVLKEKKLLTFCYGMLLFLPFFNDDLLSTT